MEEEQRQKQQPLFERFRNRKITKKKREIEMLRVLVEEAKVFKELKRLREDINENNTEPNK